MDKPVWSCIASYLRARKEEEGENDDALFIIHKVHLCMYVRMYVCIPCGPKDSRIGGLFCKVAGLPGRLAD